MRLIGQFVVAGAVMLGLIGTIIGWLLGAVYTMIYLGRWIGEWAILVSLVLWMWIGVCVVLWLIELNRKEAKK